MKSIQVFINTNGPRLAKFSAIQFILLTLLAMLFYPGGTSANPGATRYLFFYNFFSELGLTQVYDGTANTISAILFFVALTLAGLGLVLFFLTLPHYFTGRVQKALCYLGTFFGIISGLSFVGVAFTPANLAFALHSLFVFAAFISFFVAVLFYTVAVFRQSGYPMRFAVVYLILAGLLAAYIYLLFAGPDASAANGRVVQVTGQKIIGYATIIVTLIQADGLEKMRGQAGVATPA
jgi:hypothetical protein